MQRSRLTPLAAFGTLAAALAPSSAFADRPGTPNGESAHQCSGYDTLPAVCVTVNNTATEEVRFDIQFTVDGVEVDTAYDPNQPHQPGRRPLATPTWKRPDFKVRCGVDPRVQNCAAYEAAQHYIGPNRTDLVFGFMSGGGKPFQGKTGAEDENGTGILPQAFKVNDLDYGVTYCFRFKARRASDDMVSELWSNWACATTDASPPPKPAPSPWVSADFTPGDIDWRVKPPRVVIKWGRSIFAGHYDVELVNAPNRDAARARLKMVEGVLEAHDTPGAEISANVNNPDLVYRVCAVNISGSACTTHSTHVSPGGSVPLPPKYEGDVTVPNKPEQDTNRPVPTDLPATNGDQVGRPSGGFGTGMASAGGQDRARSTACAPGYVWRVARAEDLVCVTPDARGRIRQENTNGPRHVNPTGAYGPNTCDAGYVWRDAFDGDVVCVTPEGRALARQENAEGPSHLADQGEVFRAPR